MLAKRPLPRGCSRVALVAIHPNFRKAHTFSTLSATASMILVLLPASRVSHAQGAASVQFQTPITLVSPASLGNPVGPFGAALDTEGNLFVSDFNNDRVLEIPNGCKSTACQVALPTSGLSGPTGVTVDGGGNVFIADYNNNRVVELPWAAAGYGAQITLPGTGQNFPSGVAVDKAGDVFIANDDYTGTTANRVVELPSTGSGYGTPVTAVSWLNGPFGLAIDASDNLFIADYSGDEVVELPKGCSSSACQIMITNGASLGPTAVSVDQASNIFVSYYGSNQVVEVPAGCSTSACQINIASGLNQPAGVTVGKDGNTFIADYGNNRVLKVHPNSFDMGSVSVGSTGSLTAYINFNSTVSLNTAAPYSLLTQGTSSLDFDDAGGGTCTGTIYNSGQSCSVTINFKPQFAGAVNGALVLYDASGDDVAAGYLTGVGSGPQLTFLPGAKSSLGVSLLSTPGVAIDREGDVFVADKTNRTVEELLAPAYTTARQLGGGFNFISPVGLALDGAGNVFVADTGSQVIEVIRAPGYATVSTLGSGFSSASGVAVDGRGNIYVADTGHNAIKEILEAGGYTTVDTLGSSFNAPAGVAVDGDGNVYIADTGNGAVKEILALDGSIPAAPTIKTLAGSFNAPAGIAVDDLRNVYVADTGNDVVDELTAASGFSSANKLGSGFSGPSGVAVDSSGNVYVGSTASIQIVKLNYADPPTLNFAVSVGSTSNPQTVTVTNYGNADLTFASPASGYNPSVSNDFTIEMNQSTGSPCPILSTSSGPAMLAAGTSCTNELTFSPPAAGIVRGSLITADNELNVSGSTQAISLIGSSVIMTLNPSSLVSAEVGTPYSQQIIASGGAAPYSYQVTAGLLPAGIMMDASGLFTGTPSAAGSFTFTVTATDADGLHGSQAYSLSVSAPTIKLAPSSLPAAWVSAVYNQTLTAGGGTAPYSYIVTSGSLPAGLSLSSSGMLSGTPTASGSFTFIVTTTDSSTGTGAPFSAGNSYTLSVNSPVSSSNFSFTVTGSSSATINPGGTATFNFALAPSSTNYPGTVTFSMEGVPAGAISTLSATSVSSSAGPQTISLTITSSSNSASVHPLRSNRRYAPLAFALLLPLLGLRRIRLRRRKLFHAFRLMILLAAGALTIWPLFGCGAVSGVLGNSYSVAVTAISGPMQHTAFVNVTVK